MFVFAGFATFVSAQTEPTASKKSENSAKVVCTPEEKASCQAKMANSGKACCAKGSATSTAAKSEKAPAPAQEQKTSAATTGNRK